MITVALLNSVGCQSESEVKAYVVPSESEQIFLTELLQDQYPIIPFEWAAPEEWASATLDQFSKVAWKAGDSIDSGRVTVSAVSIGMGVDPQLTRLATTDWYGRTEEGAHAGAESIDIGDTTATYIDLQGKTETIAGMILPVDGDLWVFKYRGPNKLASAEKKLFRTFCESVTPSAAGPLEVSP